MVLFRALLIFGALFGTSLAAFGATSANLSVSASIVGNGHCTVTTPNTLQFGNLDAFNPANQTATVQIVVNCVGIGNKGTTYVIDYLNPSAPNNLQHTSPASPDVIPYSLNLPISGFAAKNNNTYNHTITGTILGNDYKMAPIGGYTDTVTLILTP